MRPGHYSFKFIRFVLSSLLNCTTFLQKNLVESGTIVQEPFYFDYFEIFEGSYISMQNQQNNNLNILSVAPIIANTFTSLGPGGKLLDTLVLSQVQAKLRAWFDEYNSSGKWLTVTTQPVLRSLFHIHHSAHGFIPAIKCKDNVQDQPKQLKRKEEPPKL